MHSHTRAHSFAHALAHRLPHSTAPTPGAFWVWHLSPVAYAIPPTPPFAGEFHYRNDTSKHMHFYFAVVGSGPGPTAAHQTPGSPALPPPSPKHRETEGPTLQRNVKEKMSVAASQLLINADRQKLQPKYRKITE